MPALTAGLRVVEVADGFVEGPELVRVPDAEYLAACIRHTCVEVRQFGGAPKVYLNLRLLDAGAHTDKELFRAYRVLRVIDRQRFIMGRRSDLLKMYARVMEVPDHRQRLDRISLRALRGMLLIIRTRTIDHDSKGRELPEALRYSVVDDILRRG